LRCASGAECSEAGEGAAERNAYIQGRQAEVAQKLAEETYKPSDASALLNKAKLRREMVELKTEGDATLQSIAEVSVGSVMQWGQPFITLVPADTPIEIEAHIFGHDNGFMHVGNPVAIKFDTFLYSQFGMAAGGVQVVGPRSFTAQDEARNSMSAVSLPTSTDPFYRARIQIDHVALRNVPEGFRVTPGCRSPLTSRSASAPF